MAVGGGALWVATVGPATLQELDPTTLAPIAPPLALTRTRVYGLAPGDGYLWASASDDGDVLHIDPATRTITRVHVGGFPIGIILAGGSVWVIDNANANVLRLARASSERSASPSTPPPGAPSTSAPPTATCSSPTKRTARSAALTKTPAKPPEHQSESAPPATNPTTRAYAIAPAGTGFWATSQTTNTISRIHAQP